jgi:TRAP-type C4-dicarboxylate transport system permease small subunit
VPEAQPAGLFERIVRVLDAATGTLIGALVAVLAGLVLAQVFFRFALNDSLLWSDELSQYCNVWITFLGAALVTYGWGHTNVPLLVDRIPESVRPYVMIPVKLIPAAFAVFLLVQGGEFVAGPFHLNSPSLGFSTRWVKLCIPISGALMLLFTVHSILRDIAEFRRGNFRHFDNQGQLSID